MQGFLGILPIGFLFELLSEERARRTAIYHGKKGIKRHCARLVSKFSHASANFLLGVCQGISVLRELKDDVFLSTVRVVLLYSFHTSLEYLAALLVVMPEVFRVSLHLLRSS